MQEWLMMLPLHNPVSMSRFSFRAPTPTHDRAPDVIHENISLPSVSIGGAGDCIQ